MKLWIPKFQEFELGNFQTFIFCELWEVPLCYELHGNYKTYSLEGIVSPNAPSYDESNVSPQLSYVPILIPTIRNTFLHLVCVIDVIKIGLIKISLSYFLFWSSHMTCHFDLTSYGVCSGLKHVICNTWYQEVAFHAIW